MLKIVGYCDRLSVAPTESVRFMVHCEEAVSYQAEIVRIIHGDVNPEGPGFKAEPVVTAIGGIYQGAPQSTQIGSYIRVPDHARFGDIAGFTIAAMIWPTLPRRGRQCLISKWDAATSAGVKLEIDGEGGLAATVGDGQGNVTEISCGGRLISRRWYHVMVSFDAEAKILALSQQPMIATPGAEDCVAADRQLDFLPRFPKADLIIAGAGSAAGQVVDSYDGKIDSPIILDRAVSLAAWESLLRRPVGPEHSVNLVAAWDFAEDIPSTRIVDKGPLSLNGQAVNLPARGMTGWNWTGEAMNWQSRPDHYGAIHFHHDDLYDCGWEPAFELEVPADLPSGAYAAHVWCGDGEDHREEDYITFFVRPPRAAGAPRPKAALLIPTASYLAYANDHSHLDAPLAEQVIGRLLVYQPSDLYIHQHRELGYSLYDTHADGSGVCYSSWLRPVLNLRPKYASWLGGHGSGLWQFNADTHIIDWLHHQGVAFDVVTDEDLETDGAGLLQPYRVVLSGTHPEYHSKRMSDALMAWLGAGGRLMYLGGNGWYWRIAWHPDLPGVIEVRRAEGGTRAWAAEPGEYYHSFSGEFGGLWRRNGRPPNQVVGVGFVAQGFDISTYYVRRPGSNDPRAAFIFDGVDDEVIGDFGLVGGGAAGLEFDKIDHSLGTPANALVLATSEYHTDLILPVVEETNVMTPDLTGSQSARVSADLVFYETPAGGAVFSVGSISWCGSLSHNAYDNNVSRITGNVLNRFLETERFG